MSVVRVTAVADLSNIIRHLNSHEQKQINIMYFIYVVPYA